MVKQRLLIDASKLIFVALYWTDLSSGIVSYHWQNIGITRPFTPLPNALLCGPFMGETRPPILRYEKGTSLVSTMDQILNDQDAALDDLEMHLLRAQQKMKTYADSKCHNEDFHVRDMMFLWLQPYCQQSLARQASEKLADIMSLFRCCSALAKLPIDCNFHLLPPSIHFSMFISSKQLRGCQSKQLSESDHSNAGIILSVIYVNDIVITGSDVGGKSSSSPFFIANFTQRTLEC